MPTIFTHPAVPLAIGFGLGANVIPPRLMAAGVVASVIPDLDVIAFWLNIAYSSEWGHRGFTHSLAFAVVLGIIAAVIAPALRSKRFTALLFVTISAASHGLLDMLTTGGLGVALLWPYAGERMFFPWRVIVARRLASRSSSGSAAGGSSAPNFSGSGSRPPSPSSLSPLQPPAAGRRPR